jgi:hypothetical protein
MSPRIPTFHLGLPQRIAALLLLIFLGECLYLVNRQQPTSDDYRYARCGREMWERPSPLAGYFTTCGNLNGDGTFAYRAAALPLTLNRLALLTEDHFRKPENRIYSSTALQGSAWESRHEIPLTAVKWLMHLPFVLFAAWLGAGLWWVVRRLFGNEGGALALTLYIFSPAILHFAISPNNEILAAWGLYGAIYTAMGVAHAMQGPRRKWRPRIVLLTIALGLAAAAHLLAGMIAFLAILFFLFYLADRRRSAVMPIVIYVALGALAILFAAFSFRPAPFSYVFTGGGGRFWFSLDGVRTLFFNPFNFPILAAALISLVLYLGVRRSRYFGNTAPLLTFLAVLFLQTTQVFSAPWLWALPFLLTFIGGVFADALETPRRKLFLALTVLLVLFQITVCLTTLPHLT